MTAPDGLIDNIPPLHKQPWDEPIGPRDVLALNAWKTRQYKTSASASVEAKSQPQQEKIYIIQKGDSFRSIAKKNKVDFQALLKLNNKSPKSFLLPGEKLLLPSISTSVSSNENKPEVNQTSKLQGGKEHLLMDHQEKGWEYFSDYARELKQNICATYAYSRVADILRSQGKYFHMKEVNAWDIKNSRYLAQFDQKKLDLKNLKSQLCSAPKGAMLTLRYNDTKRNKPGVSHVMVSLGDGKYTDLFGTQIRKLDFNQFNFSEAGFNDGKYGYSFTEDARLIVPKLDRFDDGKSQFFDFSNSLLSPNEVAKSISKQTGLSIHYIKMNIARENNISLSDFNKKYSNLKVIMPIKNIRPLHMEQKNGGFGTSIKELFVNQDNVLKDFISVFKTYKKEILKYYSHLTNYEYDEIAARAIGILFKETNGGLSGKWIGKKIFHFARSFEFIKGDVESIGNKWMNNAGDEYSRGYTQIKFEGNLHGKDRLRTWLAKRGIRSGEDLDNPSKSALATMMFLIEKYIDYILPMHADERWKETTQYDQAGNIVKRASLTYYNAFDYLYYTRNKPSEIVKRTATPQDSIYVKQSNNFIDQYLS